MKELPAPIALLRPLAWAPYLGLVLLGWADSGSQLPLWSALWAILYLSAGYGFNGACDAPTDDPAKNPVVAGKLSRKSAVILSLALFAVALLIGFRQLFDIIWLMTSMIATGILYSLPRIGLKRIPFIGTLANLWLFVPLYWIGAERMPGVALADGLLFAVLAIPSLQSQLIHEAMDEAEDARSGVRTSVRILGKGRVPGVLIFLSLATFGTAFAAHRFGPLPLSAALAIAAAAIIAAIPVRTGPSRFKAWRRRVQMVYAGACTIWLLDMLAAKYL